MSAFDDLKARYFVLGSSGGSFSSGSSGLPEYAGCEVTPHIGGPDYFRTLKTVIDRSDVAYIYLAGWWLDVNCEMVPGVRLLDLLKARSAAGVDVRILGWVMPPDVLNNPIVTSGRVPLADMLRVNENTMRFVAAARAEPKLADKAMLNVLSHPAGAVHTKLALVGGPSGDVGFTGGIDPQQGRNSPAWHDVQAEVRGTAVQPMLDWFRAMWNENQGRSPVTVQANGFPLATRTAGAAPLAARTAGAATAGTKHVQSGRTVPRMNFSTVGGIGASLAGVSLPQNQPVSWAPTGLAEIRQLWQKGISGAQRYVYIEDQAFTSAEIFDWLNSALKASPALKVVLLIGADDPTAPNPGPMSAGMRKALNEHLLAGISAADISTRVGFFTHKTKVIHTKSTVVDDNWALIGSANMMRRSLYTDMEHSIGFMDEAGSGVAAYRSALWSVHNGPPVLSGLGADLARWLAIPYAGAPGSRPIDRVHLPFTVGATPSAQDQALLDQLMDVDSRDAWGSGLLSLAMTATGAGLSSP
jgi:phosphatidylserine/phosphatidylglycerophosphate/cardiolipin synthase-like enzyme